jgi:phosphopantetheine--protein transferase-like protein
MIAGIGVDMVDISGIRRHAEPENGGGAFLRHTFTQAERDAAAACPDPIEHLAGCFAAKEAAFKAVAGRLPERGFDLRIVEQLNDESGAPYLSREGAFADVLADAGVSRVHVSITDEGDFALAFVVAESV